MKYEILFAPNAKADLKRLRAYDRNKVLDAIETHLRYEPEKLSKSRIKRLQEMDRPQYRLRVEYMRVFYDVMYIAEDGYVEILAIQDKSKSMQWLVDHGVKSE